MATLIAIPILSILTVIQSAIVSRLPLLLGTPDIILIVLIAWALQERVRNAWAWSLFGGLCIGFVSIIPISVPVIAYLLTTGIVIFVRRRIWEKDAFTLYRCNKIDNFTKPIVKFNFSSTHLCGNKRFG